MYFLKGMTKRLLMVGVEGVLSMVAKVDPGPCCLEFGQGSSLLGPNFFDPQL